MNGRTANPSPLPDTRPKPDGAAPLAERPRPAARGLAALARVHRDENGSISIVSVFALLMLVFLLGLVMNAGRQVDQKVKMQNAADASAYAGGIVLARGMNTLAFTNHLLCDVFALTAFYREAYARNAESLTPEILDNWERVAPAFANSEVRQPPRTFGLHPFEELDAGITAKVPEEREMVRTFSEWAFAQSELMLPVFEAILAERMIPHFQRPVVDHTPRLAQYAADEIARRHGGEWPRRVVVRGVLWRTMVDPVGGMGERARRTLPVVDPVLDRAPNQQKYFTDARNQRSQWSHAYLRDWNNERLRNFDRFGKMSQFANLWRNFTCAQLEKLLNEEYPDTNLPFQIRVKHAELQAASQPERTEHLEQDFMFVGVVYRRKMNDRIPGVFKNPIPSDTQAYAQIMMFVSGNWDLMYQGWNVHLSPATSASIPAILSTYPYVNNMPPLDMPNLSAVTEDDLQWLSHH